MSSVSRFSFIQQNLIRAYDFVNRTGALKTPLGKWIFETAYFQYKRFFEDSLADFLKQNRLLFNDKISAQSGIIYDVGANLGYTAQVFLRAFSKNCQVVGFEPELGNFEALKHRMFGFKNFFPVHAAVGSEVGKVKIWENEKHHADHRVAVGEFDAKISGANKNFQTVELTSLDSFHESFYDRAELSGFVGNDKLKGKAKFENVLFVKIDVQGYEIAVLEGMTQILQSVCPPIVYLEYAPQAMRELGFSNPEKVFDFFPSNRFNVWGISRGKKAKLLNRDSDSKFAIQLQDLCATSGYVDLAFVFKDL